MTPSRTPVPEGNAEARRLVPRGAADSSRGPEQRGETVSGPMTL